MRITDLTKQPTLTLLSLDDEETVAKYGEPLEFYTLSPFPLDVFMKFQLRDTKDLSSTITVLKDVILDVDGKKVLSGDLVLPIPVLLKVISKLTVELGK